MAWCDVVEPRTLRECRIALGQSQAAFAAMLGVSPESYRTWDAGRRAPPPKVLAQARALAAHRASGPRPETVRRTIDYAKSQGLAGNVEAKFMGGGAVLKLDDGFATFTPVSSTFLFHSESEGFFVPYPGRYRIAVEAYPYQVDEPDKPVTLTLYRGIRQGAAASLDALIGMIDLVGPTPRTLEITPFLRPGDLIAPSVADLVEPPGDPAVLYLLAGKNVRDYTGEGIALRSMTIEGPLFDSDIWPPVSARQLLTGVDFDEAGEIQLTKDPYTHVVEIVETFATRAFRRPLHDGELETYTSLAKPVLAEGRPFLEAVRVSLRAILSAPAFLYQSGAPGALDDYGLASRLSYFLWRSMPDDQLFDLAGEGRLTDPTVLAAQVDRMLDDAKSARFVTDFGGQTFRLYEIKATTPDAGLYPEYDDRLGQAMAQETELFLTELIADNHGVGELIDADFTYVNRRLAEHYGLPGVDEQHMRRIALPADSPRGGLLTQGSILKITSNGTTTSPVPRGNFVLANLLGQPAPPPPPGVAGLEPDTRGTTTIREQLEAHRSNPVCGSCHRVIDPPGFALESFDPVGGFRTSYRVSLRAHTAVDNTLSYSEGPAVDPSSTTPDGHAFAGIEEYKQILLKQQLDQVARHLTSQLLVFGTGAEIAFADRDTVEQILDQGRTGGHPVRTMIHQVVQSDLFRRR